MDVETTLAGAALRLTVSHPYLGAAIWALKRVPVPGLRTVAVDAGWRFYFDPVAVACWNSAEVSGALYHEICHLLRGHPVRMPPGAESWRWNVACDAEINDDLEQEDVRLPEGAIYPGQLGRDRDKLAEEYYQRLEATRALDARTRCRQRRATVARERSEDGTSQRGAIHHGLREDHPRACSRSSRALGF